MKSPMVSVTVRQSLCKLGQDMKIARQRRRLPMRLVAERAGIGLSTMSKIEKGDSNVSLGNYAAVFWALGLGTPFGRMLDPATDQVGLDLDLENLPQRIRIPKIL